MSTSVPWRYEVQQVDIVAPGDVGIADVYFSIEGPANDTSASAYLNATSWPTVGVSLLDLETSAAELSAALETLPSAGTVTVVRVPPGAVGDSSVASRHLVTFLTRGGDVPLLKAEKWTVNATATLQDDNR